jgi:coenzyme F420-reducing hydrogenase delta subunit
VLGDEMDIFKLGRNLFFSPEDNTGGTDNKPVDSGKSTFTQEQIDEIVSKRLAEQKTKFYSKLGVNDEKEIDIILTNHKKYDTISKELTELNEKEKVSSYKSTLKTLGIEDDLVDFVLTKIPQDEKFEDTAKEFVKANPKYLKETFTKMNSVINLDGTTQKDISKMTSAEYLEWRAKNKL